MEKSMFRLVRAPHPPQGEAFTASATLFSRLLAVACILLLAGLLLWLGQSLRPETVAIALCAGGIMLLALSGLWLLAQRSWQEDALRQRRQLVELVERQHVDNQELYHVLLRHEQTLQTLRPKRGRPTRTSQVPCPCQSADPQEDQEAGRL